MSRDLLGAFQEMQDVASGSTCQKFMYHANIDGDTRYPMTREQWRESVDALEKKLGLTDQPRVGVMHVKEGREHCHVGWSRIKPETMTAISDSHNYRKHEEVSRELERRFGHERVQGAHAEREDKPRPARTPDHADIQQQERLGKPGRAGVAAIKAVKADLTALWQQTASGKDFAAALAARGYILAQGDRRDFVVLDSAGAVHSLARRIEGVKTAAVRERMADVDRASLPTLEQATAHQRKAKAEDGATDSTRAKAARSDQAMQDEPTAPMPMPVKDGTAKGADRREAADPRDDQSARYDRTAPDARAVLEAEAVQQAPRQAGLLAQMERQEQARRAFVAEQTAAAEKARAEQEAREREDAARARNGDITDAKNRYAQALGDEYDIRDPYASLARAAMNEYGRFARQQETLTQQIAEAKTPEDRRTLELRKEIEGCEYMVITSHRLAGISRAITGNVNSEQAQRDEAKAKFYQERAAELRAERAEIEKGGTGTERGEGKAPKSQDRQPEALASSRTGPADTIHQFL
ncbi:MAG: relaxase/mobilization nuclease domain-containing protein [Alphaproteobacteria bacterium]|nr:relaxase/mobilization nuclease domain-containing protein [Alphaproteobacteria bacterium]